MALLSLVILLLVVCSLAMIRVPVLVWTLVIGVTLILITYFIHPGKFGLTIYWALYIVAVLFANLSRLRRFYFMLPLINKLQQRMPAISDTEREAIEAGDVWWEKDLFCGRPQWKKFLAIPQPKLTAEEQAFIDTQVEQLCGMFDDWNIVNDRRDMPEDVWNFLKKERFFGMVIPKEYGGRGFSAIAHSSVIVKIASRSFSVAVNTMVPNSLGPGELILHYGTQEQKEYYLPRLARGDEIPCFALTGPEAGSDAGSITDSGIVCRGEYNGKEVLGIRLTWDKRYITLAPVATVLGLAIRLYDPDHLIGKKDDVGITLCLVPTSHPGVEIGNRHLPLHMAFMNGPTRGNDVFIPIEWVIGGNAMIGNGWRMLMECLSMGRGISLPALSTACGKLCYRMTGAYSRLRKQFNTSIANFEGVEEALANIGGLTYLLEASRIMTAGAVDLKIKPAIATAIAKYNMTEIAREVLSDAMDVHAGHGIQVGPRNFLAHANIAIPISITVEGANILTRNLIIFGQGAIRCHPYILQEVELFSAEHSQDKLKKLDKLLMSHIGYVMSNVVRNIWCGLTAGKLNSSPVSGPLARYYRQITRMSVALSLLADATMMLLGGSLKRKERISARLGDMLSQLYLASAVLKYFNDHGQPASDVDHAKWAIEHCLFETQHACDELLNNFPYRWLGKLLHWIIFPYGTAYRRPRDELSHRLVASMLAPSDLRDRITQYFYVSPKPEDPIRRIDTALAMSINAEPLLKKYQNALRTGALPKLASFEDRMRVALKTNVFAEHDIQTLREYDAIQKEVIKVDEFSFDLNTVVS